MTKEEIIVLEPKLSEQLNTIRLKIIIFVWIVILCSIPVWWKTTTVYRAPLPYSSIYEIQTNDVDFRIKFLLHMIDNKGSSKASRDGEVDRLAKQVEKQVNAVYADISKGYPFKFSVQGKLEDSDFWAEKSSDTTLEAAFAKRYGNESEYHLFVKCVDPHTKSRLVVGQRRALFLALADKCTEESIISNSASIISGLFADEQVDLGDIPGLKIAETASDRRTIEYSPKYQIVFSLLVGDPADGVISWEARAAVEKWIKPLLNQLRLFSEVELYTQVLNYASLPVQPTKSLNGYYFVPKDLSLFINSAEWNLASVVSTAPPLNLILYVPPVSQSPLYILQSNGEQLDTNAFLIPRWGGVIIDNPKYSNGLNLPKLEAIGAESSSPDDISIPNSPDAAPNSPIHYSLNDLEPKFEIFIEHIRRLLGIAPIQIRGKDHILQSADVTYLQSSTGITQLELDRIVRRRVVGNIKIAKDTLVSLANLLQSLENMVVEDHIQALVTQSLKDIEQAKTYLLEERYEEAVSVASQAVLAAEAAFFDPTMVPLLYFPDEHKFAVYMPFFVPVGVPLIVGLLKELKLLFQVWRASRKSVKAKKD